MNQKLKYLDIYVDESGNFDNYSKHNLIYVVAFVMVESETNNDSALLIFNNKLKEIITGKQFVHTGNLVRGEKPYEGMPLRYRQDLFYILFLLAKYSEYKVVCSVTEKKDGTEELYSKIVLNINEKVLNLSQYFSSFDVIYIHYDDGQIFLKQTLMEAFSTINKKVNFVKTLQHENPFMQVADLYSYFELLKYKIKKSGLTRHEIAFFGTPRKVQKDYFKQLQSKYFTKNYF